MDRPTDRIAPAGRVSRAYRLEYERAPAAAVPYVVIPDLIRDPARKRRNQLYAVVPQLALKPGHSLYEKIKQEVLDEYEGDEAEVRESLDKFLEDMRERRLANEKILTEAAVDEALEAETDEDAGDEAPGTAGPSIRSV